MIGNRTVNTAAPKPTVINLHCSQHEVRWSSLVEYRAVDGIRNIISFKQLAKKGSMRLSFHVLSATTPQISVRRSLFEARWIFRADLFKTPGTKMTRFRHHSGATLKISSELWKQIQLSTPRSAKVSHLL